MLKSMTAMPPRRCCCARSIAALIAARERTGRHIEEAFVFRNHPQWREVERLIGDGSIGTARAVQGTLARQFHDPADIRNNPAMGGGAMLIRHSFHVSPREAPQRIMATPTIVKKIVDDHHGSIELESEVNKGTTFRLFFPLA